MSVVKEESLKVCSLLASLSELQNAKRVAFFLPMEKEIDVTSVLTLFLDNKECYVPRVLDSENMSMLRVFSSADLDTFELSSWGIPEPPLNDTERVLGDPLDVILVPCVALDKEGHRLGHGKGYYDKFISQTIVRGTRPFLIGVCLGYQLIDHVPTTALDVNMDVVVSPSGVLRFM